MKMYFPLPSYLEKISCDPVQFLEYVLCDQGPGSLSRYLEERDLGKVEAFKWVL